MCVVCVVNDSVVNYLRQATTYCLYKVMKNLWNNLEKREK